MYLQICCPEMDFAPARQSACRGPGPVLPQVPPCGALPDSERYICKHVCQRDCTRVCTHMQAHPYTYQKHYKSPTLIIKEPYQNNTHTDHPSSPGDPFQPGQSPRLNYPPPPPRPPPPAGRGRRGRAVQATLFVGLLQYFEIRRTVYIYENV